MDFWAESHGARPTGRPLNFSEALQAILPSADRHDSVQGPVDVSAALSEFPELRVSTVTPASVKLLQGMGAWEDVAPPRSAAFARMQAGSPVI